VKEKHEKREISCREKPGTFFICVAGVGKINMFSLQLERKAMALQSLEA